MYPSVRAEALVALITDLNTTSQLDAGVRMLTAQVHDNNGSWHLCHSDCALLDAGPLSSWLATIKDWLDKHPYDVVSILLVNSDFATANDLDGEFKTASIKTYAYAPRSTDAASIKWPTLDELIRSGKRLVTFIADIVPSTAAPYLMDEFTFVFENPYSVTSLSNFSCVPQRPAVIQGQASAAVQSGRLPLMNHFLNIRQAFDIQIPDVGNLSITNAASGPTGNLGDAAAICAAAYGGAPTFILVDFFQHGSSISTVDRLNGIVPVGRVTTVNNVSAHELGTSAAQVGKLGPSLSYFTRWSLICLLTTLIGLIT
ncbi:MAG: hypothetical protein LQ337_003730 [Flavoplaca oasis]|nr:MAG: hypothetical protein LQ337_003730 [Flavoplaca oasis]